LYDIAIIGGGVNGCGIARDAAGRGLSVLLAEKDDLASGTSSTSTKLIHGGLRYLENHQFKMVRSALREREILLRMAPHIIWPLRFVLPHHKGLRPAWLLRLGLFLYDHLGGRDLLPASRGLDLTQDVAGEPLHSVFARGFEYSDCWADDARLVVLNAMDARQRGARILTRTHVRSAQRTGGHWSITLEHAEGGAEPIEARALVNSGGPWVSALLEQTIRSDIRAPMRLVKGSHIIVSRLFDHPKAYIFQNSDGRIAFAIPYEDDFTLIGTTDVDYEGDPGAAAISPDEIAYLCDAASSYFRAPVKPDSIVHTYAGVRALLDEGGAAQKVSRDYVLTLDGGGAAAPLLNVCGGKLTTFRRLAEDALRKLGGVMEIGPAWTAGAALPGGDFPVYGGPALERKLMDAAPAVNAALARRLVRTYGTRALHIMEGAHTPDDMGENFGAGLSEREVHYLVEHEWAQTADDILWRRTKLGLRMDAAKEARLATWLRDHVKLVTVRNRESQQ
jgi:glycerol-3-phosphate dehydrogenase